MGMVFTKRMGGEYTLTSAREVHIDQIWRIAESERVLEYKRINVQV